MKLTHSFSWGTIIIYHHMYLTLTSYSSFSEPCLSNYPTHKSWYLWGTMTCYCVMKHPSQSCERVVHIVASCWILLKSCVWLFHLWKLHIEFFRIHLAYLLELFLNAVWGQLICFAFTVHHMPTLKSQRGTSWMKCVLVELQYQLFWEETGVYDFWDMPWLQDIVSFVGA
jgi:hypothetical protein